MKVSTVCSASVTVSLSLSGGSGGGGGGPLPFRSPSVSFLRTSKSSLSIACSLAGNDASSSSPAKLLRRILDSPGVHQGPACFDALSAKLVQTAGFQFCFTSGFSISASRLALPDTGLISYGEILDQGRLITQAVSIPVIGDADNGYGNAMNLKRTLKGYIGAGFAGIILEDQVAPKACGHTRGRRVVSREEAVMKIKAAVDARRESGCDIVIVARTDARQAVSLDEALVRSRAFADAGADVLFIDALASREEMKAFCEVSPLVPKMANMLEGGGKTPILNPMELEEIGFKIVAYPLSLIGVSIRAMQDSLIAIKGGRIPPPGSMPSFEEIKDILGFNAYYEEEKRYAANASPQLSKGESSSLYSIRGRDQVDTEQTSQSFKNPIVEVITPDAGYNKYGADTSRNPFSGIWSRTLRVKLTGRDGFEKLDLRIPAGFLDGITNIVPALGGVNIKELLDDAAEEVGGKLLLDFEDRMGDRIQIFLE
ncbi:2,3-dimethylmalate lyase-like isoform X1 [Vigna umbellata]|uniref:2,3-dimethylmalate lyase-like isoform X1 n=1 Tax=Vigna umbellata TaxID=87088 RepID=UPI001F5E7C44|nr:2,3-dimethylmalate lyase-like isoform X1 [Vigna umbellata]XP_047172615.1 2,3-dimethylmalate lyase-like isoform X1 [Vigna umbellata]XP_047172616.1 2,3-dimethylmalate lyase-like isoform X1 [Vigna umbellata]